MMDIRRFLYSIFWFSFISLVVIACSQTKNIESTLEKVSTPIIQDTIALNQLLKDAEIAMSLNEFSVMDNPPIPPSGDKHDYYSWSSYFWPNPETEDGKPYILKDGKINPDTDIVSDKPLLRRMVMAVETLALAYSLTGKVEYASKANAFLQTWFINEYTKMNSHLKFAQCVPGEERGQPYGVIDTRWLIILTHSINLLKEKGGISSDDFGTLKVWFMQYLDWLHTSETGVELRKYENNIGSWYMAQKAAYAIFTSQKELAKSILKDSEKFFNHQIDSIGRVTHELERTKSFDYSLYSINALLTLIEVERSINPENLLNTNHNQEVLLKSIKYMASFNETDNPWPYPQIAKKAIALHYEDGISFSVYYPYDLYYTIRKGYHLFKDTALLDAINNIPKEQVEAHRANLMYLQN